MAKRKRRTPTQRPPAEQQSARVGVPPRDTPYEDVPEHLRCPTCWHNWGGVGKPKSNWRRGNVVMRSYRCIECGAEWQYGFRPADHCINGHYYSIQEIIEFELNIAGQRAEQNKESHAQ